MKVPDKHFVIAKAKKYLAEDIGPSRYMESLQISGWQYAEYDASSAPHSLADFYAIPESDFKPIAFQDRWGGHDRTAWFKTTVALPAGFITPGTKLGFSLNMITGPGWGTNVECLLHINGKPVQGLDHKHTEALLDESLAESGTLEIAIKAWAGLSKDTKIRIFPETNLIKIHTQTDEFYFTALTLANSIELLGEHDLRRFKLTKLLQETFIHINFINPKSEAYYESIKTALASISRGLALLRRPEIKPIVHTVGHSHIDMAWLWRLAATREKASRTFTTVLNLMKQFPEYYFMHSSPQLYKFLQEDYPEIFDLVKQKIQSGQWEATGGMWVEADTNIPSGESLVRQFLYGKRYLKQELGVESTVLWLPDVFGYSAALPQIAKKSGIDYFMTTKISWNQYNHFPHDTFNWRGLDGAEILTHFITTPTGGNFYTYNGELTPREIPGIWETYKQKDINEHLLLAYGYGDGGGGPTREMLMTRRAIEDIPGIPYVKTNKVEPYFTALGQSLEGKQLETYDGELYFEFHRGTYTSQAYSKKANRQMECLLHSAELLGMMHDLKLGTNTYPALPLHEIWERVLLLQFHDIIPGTSIRQVYEDSRNDYELLIARTKDLIASSTTAINNEVKLNQDSIAVYNHLSWRRDTAEMFIPFSDRINEDTTFTDSEGYTLESQKTEGGLHVVFTELPPLGYKTFAITKETLPEADDSLKLETSGGSTTLDTNFYNVEFDSNGEITSLYDKLAKRYVGKGNLNVLQAYEDKPMAFDAWDIDVFYKEKPYTCFEYSGLEVVEHGHLRVILRRKITFNNSQIEQDIIFYARNRRIDFATKVEWNERQTLLKAAFPLDIRATSAAYDIQFGFVERANHNNDERDFAQFEVCGHKWADVSESGYGVALFNDCKYGYDCKDSILRLTLIKSPISPDETADVGIHEFTYALYPHLGNLVGSYVQTRAEEFNNPVECYEIPATENGGYFVEFSMLKVDALIPQLMDEDPSLHIVVDTVKKSEDGKDLILRVYENNNRALNDAVILMDSCVRFTEVIETNLLEEPLPEQNVRVDGQGIVFDIKPFEIKTFRLVL
ncbi:MAG: alpha-mannosidase [Defluviitaleaceae bacterium]|nr:alpha-mannosidase [Defluviitaleaceae bacterium]